MPEIRWNLVLFAINLLFLLGVVIWFAVRMISPEMAANNQELIIGGVLALVSSTISFVGGYSIGVQQALTSPGDPAPAVTEKTFMEAMEMVKGVNKE